LNLCQICDRFALDMLDMPNMRDLDVASKLRF